MGCRGCSQTSHLDPILSKHIPAAGLRMPRREPIAATEKAIPDITDRRYPRNMRNRGDARRSQIVKRSPNLRTAGNNPASGKKSPHGYRPSSQASSLKWEDALRD